MSKRQSETCSPFSSKYGGRLRLPKKADNPFKMDYDPELNTSPELNPDAASYYLTHIGILRWMIELRRIVIITKFHYFHPMQHFPERGI